MLVAERARLEALAAFRRASAMRLRAARLYRLGAEVLGELSAEGRERWIRGTVAALPRYVAMTDADVCADAAADKARQGIIVASDGSEWTTPGREFWRTRLGPEIPPDFHRFVRRF